MTNPTITNNQGFLEDCYDKTGYAITNVGAMGAPTHTIEDDDFFALQATYDGAGSDYIYAEKDITNVLGYPTYTHYVCRWKTNSTSNGCGAMVKLVGTTGVQTIVGDAVSSPQLPAYSTDANFTTSSGTIDIAIGDIDKIQFYLMATTGGAAGTYQVYYDFLMLCQDKFTFPSVSGSLTYEVQNRYGYIPIPTRIGSAIQYLGMEEPTIRMTGEMNSDSAWGTPHIGDKLYQIALQSHSNPWQWFTSDLGDFKVVLDSFRISQDGAAKALRTWELVLKQYSRSGGQIDHHGNLDWFGW